MTINGKQMLREEPSQDAGYRPEASDGDQSDTAGRKTADNISDLFNYHRNPERLSFAELVNIDDL